ncbi:MAG: leucine-rich repeat domain-containing protein, partial [Bacteroidales bacterium]|nr:leucine-rich repeat domain-containing protein [Bacteroidales bacterium]
MKTVKNIFIILFFVILSEYTWAYDFSAVHEGQTIYYNITSDTEPYTVEVTFQNTNYEEAFYTDFPIGSMIIPDYVMHNGKNYKVTAIAPFAFYGCDSLTEINLGNHIALIDFAAFYECSRLSIINIPHTVKRIGEAAFQHCSGITSMHIPDSVQTIEYFAFSYCTKLKTFTVGKNNTRFTVKEDI